jgi:glycosyltransferase involved in cell wall biosynthesis
VLPPSSEGSAKGEARARLGIAPDCKLIGNAGWLIPRKRWDVFIGVAAQVATVMPEARFVIAGEGPEKQGLLKLAEELGIHDRILWLGWCDQLDDFYRALDVMLFNSDWDALGRTPLEAMSFGVPVVASVLHGGLKEVIDSKEFGVLLDRHDLKALSSAVVNLLQNSEEAEKISEKGRIRVRDIGSPSAHASRVLKLLTIKGSHSQGE